MKITSIAEDKVVLVSIVQLNASWAVSYGLRHQADDSIDLGAQRQLIVKQQSGS